MDLDRAISHMLQKPGALETYPFGPETPVFKVGGKMFALIGIHESGRIRLNLKYYPEAIEILRQTYEEVVPGYHMNKRHWNSVYIDGNLPDDLVLEWIDISYELVFDKLTKAGREAVLRGERAR